MLVIPGGRALSKPGFGLLWWASERSVALSFRAVRSRRRERARNLQFFEAVQLQIPRCARDDNTSIGHLSCSVQ